MSALMTYEHDLNQEKLVKILFLLHVQWCSEEQVNNNVIM